MRPDDQDLMIEDTESGPRIVGRSILYNLEPIAMGTPDVEGLRSYVVRLARSHGITVRHMVRRVLAVADPAMGAIANSAFLRVGAGTVNGLGDHSVRFAAALEALTTREGLQRLTLLPWRDLLPRNGAALLARRPQWCAACLHQALADGREIYHPLAWSIGLAVACRIHGTALIDRCPSCGKAQPFLPHQPSLLRCAHCWAKFADNPTGQGTLASGDTALWIADALGDMVAARQIPSPVDARGLFMKRVSSLVACHAEGNRATFCRTIGLKPQALKNWFARNERPSMPQFLRVCYAADRSPNALLAGTDGVQALRRIPENFSPARAPRPSLTSPALANLRTALAGARRDRQTVSSVCRSKSVRRSALKYWLPEECAAASAAAKDSLRESVEVNAARRADAVRKAFEDLAAAGTYPSRHRVEEILRRVGISLLDPTAREVYFVERRRLVSIAAPT